MFQVWTLTELTMIDYSFFFFLDGICVCACVCLCAYPSYHAITIILIQYFDLKNNSKIDKGTKHHTHTSAQIRGQKGEGVLAVLLASIKGRSVNSI